ncbi:MAG: CBS domain-containing protein [Candidatus Nanopelagicales bacterium]|nr:CBS domain-containing protein [Candidatus Nanopelagicales bacterium]MDZ4248895.1 CBS domain-containing protein [Candidatus Nanopelagicales bacterium]MDZ7578871.1 CBS domain-containing protein [Candidatus Nanopelagicales bacterium]
MLACDMAQEVPVLQPSDDALEAMRALVSSGLPGVVIQDVRQGASFTIVPASQVLRVMLPQYVLDDAALARVWDEESADTLASGLAGHTVADLLNALDRDDDEPSHTVDGDSTMIEMAALMADLRLPLVGVEDEGKLLGVVTVHELIGRLLG